MIVVAPLMIIMFILDFAVLMQMIGFFMHKKYTKSQFWLAAFVLLETGFIVIAL